MERKNEKIAENVDLAISLSKNAIKVRELYSEEKILGKYFDYINEVKKCFPN